MSGKWTQEWPTEPGRYWFYGQKFEGWHEDEESQLFLVAVWEMSNGIAYVVDGHFMYKEEGAQGWWQPAVLPELPEEDV